MTNVLVTDLGLSIPPKFFFENFIDKRVSTSVHSAIYQQYTFEMFHLPFLFELPPSSDPGHKKFWKQAACLVCGNSTCQHSHRGIPWLFPVTTIFKLSSNYRIIAVTILTVV